jgi:hypothetical protein
MVKAKNVFFILLLLFSTCFLSGFRRVQSKKINQLSLDFTCKVLEKGKYISVSGELYYHFSDKRMTTHLVQPFENITIVNSDGEMRNYDPKENTVMVSVSEINSSESSYFYHFFNQASSDMGLQKLGYKVENTRVDEGMLVTTWVPKDASSAIRKIELAHLKANIMFMGFISARNKYLGKVFFSKHERIGEYTVPMSITEISYTEKNDSVITRKIYSNPKINEQVNVKYANYQIPMNAKVVKLNK